MPILTAPSDTPNGVSDENQFEADFDGLIAATTLLQEPRLARGYVYICYYGPTTIQDLIDQLDIARATAYDDVDQLESLGVVDRDESTRPHELTATAFAFIDESEIAITPTVLHAIALSEIDDDVAYVRNRYGTTRLVKALRLAGEYVAGSLTQRMVAEKLGVTPAEGMAIVYALQPVLSAGSEHDPYFDRLFPEISDDISVDGDLSRPVSDESVEDG
ncbi:helix-turn-helix domain-containing protein [Halorientalis marina]|uniref:helix-turn-helix domain-containing protein n=1 Tax=Halorientalis marina TaxID=2931976 RepID=UPI001FF242AE|nr:helix-turn-helix domain-containing protein [Halorientalis marina]